MNYEEFICELEKRGYVSNSILNKKFQVFAKDRKGLSHYGWRQPTNKKRTEWLRGDINIHHRLEIDIDMPKDPSNANYQEFYDYLFQAILNRLERLEKR
mgnify:FL=1